MVFGNDRIFGLYLAVVIRVKPTAHRLYIVCDVGVSCIVRNGDVRQARDRLVGSVNTAPVLIGGITADGGIHDCQGLVS